jgi:hypothetical protein
VSYVCRPGIADVDAMPAATSVDELRREIRFVQNTAHLKPEARSPKP